LNIRSPENKHTDADIPEYVPAVGLEAVGRAYAKIIDEANKLDIKALGTASPAKTSTRGAIADPPTLVLRAVLLSRSVRPCARPVKQPSHRRLNGR
jgi:hypothetical protein